ncbi:MAG: glycosyltransferase family 4 protein [Candidatus Zixiibacteriota bacterium]|nr:MAG: glycosyltransferase family 4 protein [candidate division Zixibacteria bacterium]
MSPLTVVIVNDFGYVNGGASQVALSSAVELARREHDVRLFTAVGPVSPEVAESRLKVTFLDQHEIISDPKRARAGIQGIWNRRAYKEMLSLLDSLDRRRTVIHLHIWVKSLSSSAFRAVYDRDFKCVVTVHDFFMACPNGGFFDYPDSRICSLRPLSVPCLVRQCDKRSYFQKIWRVIRLLMQRSRGHIPSGVRHFITISELSKRIMQPYLPRQAYIHAVTNPIFVEKQPAASPADNANIVFVGRLDPEKGPLVFAEAAERAGVPAVFVGDGRCRAEVFRICPEAEVTGWLDHREVESRIREARALVFPSLWYEPQGLTVAEAAAIGVPAVVPDTSVAAEMIIHGDNGLVFRSGDSQDLADKLEMLEDSRVARRLGRSAYDKYWKNPATITRHVRELESVYKQILGQ